MPFGSLKSKFLANVGRAAPGWEERKNSRTTELERLGGLRYGFRLRHLSAVVLTKAEGCCGQAVVVIRI
jgi:hypothetical protein